MGSINGNLHITETTISYNIAISQYIKTAIYETFIVTAFHSPQNNNVFVLLNVTRTMLSFRLVKVNLFRGFFVKWGAIVYVMLHFDKKELVPQPW